MTSDKRAAAAAADDCGNQCSYGEMHARALAELTDEQRALVGPYLVDGGSLSLMGAIARAKRDAPSHQR